MPRVAWRRLPLLLLLPILGLLRRQRRLHDCAPTAILHCLGLLGRPPAATWHCSGLHIPPCCGRRRRRRGWRQLRCRSVQRAARRRRSRRRCRLRHGVPVWLLLEHANDLIHLLPHLQTRGRAQDHTPGRRQRSSKQTAKHRACAHTRRRK